MKMKRFSRTSILIAVILSVSLVALSAAVNTYSAPPTPEELVQAAWRRAQQSGVYHYNTEIVQTTYPAPMLANVGRSAREDRLYLEGQTNLPQREMLLTLWRDGGNVATGRDGVEVRIKGDEAYGRTSGADWQKIPDFTGAFAPEQDALAYLAGAKNVKHVESREGSVESEAPSTFNSPHYTLYSFDLDGYALGRYIRDQLERYLIDKGQLPAGLTLDISNEYKGMTGSGQVWLTSDGLPARLTMKAKFPQQQNGERVAVAIQTDFSNFAPLKRAKGLDLTGFANLSGLFSQQAGYQFSLALLVLTVVALLIRVQRSRLVYAAVVLTMIVVMVVTPLLESHQAYAFGQKQSAQRAEFEQAQKENKEQRNLIESLFTSNWDPHTSASDQLSVIGDQPPVNRDQPSAIVNPTSDIRHLASAMAAATNAAVDTDGDGLTDTDEINRYHTNPNNPDTDGDGLTDGQEVRYLGTDPLKADSDGDRITDNAEVAGFDYAGKRWYTNPRSPDTNQDGLPDGQECPERVADSPGQLSPVGAVCRDTDGDGVPDVFDDDNDGDGVPDRIDVSANKQISGLSGKNLFKLVIQSLTAGKDVLVDFQLRPANPTHLTYALNVLDWPSGDTEGQVVRTQDTTFADTMTPEQAAADPKNKNGDMRLTPMLEIVMSGATLPLPRATPRMTRQLELAATGWISLTADLAQAGADTVLTLTHTAAGTVDVNLYPGRCYSATAAPAQATPVYTLANVASGNPQTAPNQKLLAWADGDHALTFKRGDSLACLNLGDLPNGADPDQMIDADALSFYGVSARDADRNGTVVVYVPLNMVNDRRNDQRLAFAGRMLYRPDAGGWGQAQEVRLVWLVQLLNDDNQVQTIHTYQDEHTLTGLAVREDQGMNVAVALEDPGQDQDTTVDDNLWRVAEGLRAGFTSGRKNDQGQRDLTLADLKSRFDDPRDDASARVLRWGAPPRPRCCSRAKKPIAPSICRRARAWTNGITRSPSTWTRPRIPSKPWRHLTGRRSNIKKATGNPTR